MLSRLRLWSERLRRSTLAFPLAALVAALMLLISEVAYHGADGQMHALVNMGRARLETFLLLQRLTDAESGQRGYLLTGRREYLQPYQNAADDARRYLQSLQRLLEQLGNSEGQRERAKLSTAVDNKLSELAEVMRLYDAGQKDTAYELMRSGIGRDQMDTVRRQTEALVSDQNTRIALMLDSVFDTLLLNRVGVASMTVISLLMLGMFLRQSRAGAREREERRAELQAERDRLELEVARRTGELTELTSHLESAREDERARLARDLHDELGALLTAAKLDVARIRPTLQKSAPELMPRLNHLIESLNSGIALKRRIIEDLRPSTLDNLGLLAALEVLCSESAQQLGLAVHVELQAVQLSPSAELTVFRLVQESLTNIAKHAQASEVTVRLREDADQALVQVVDNGRGFDTRITTPAAHGLLGMRYRVGAELGLLQVVSVRGVGTTVTARLPLAERAAPAPSAML